MFNLFRHPPHSFPLWKPWKNRVSVPYVVFQPGVLSLLQQMIRRTPAEDHLLVSLRSDEIKSLHLGHTLPCPFPQFHDLQK